MLGDLRDRVRRRVRARRDQEQGDRTVGAAGHPHNALPGTRGGLLRRTPVLDGDHSPESRLGDRRVVAGDRRADVRPRGAHRSAPDATRGVPPFQRRSRSGRQMRPPRRHQPLVQPHAVRGGGRVQAGSRRRSRGRGQLSHCRLPRDAHREPPSLWLADVRRRIDFSLRRPGSLSDHGRRLRVVVVFAGRRRGAGERGECAHRGVREADAPGAVAAGGAGLGG